MTDPRPDVPRPDTIPVVEEQVRLEREVEQVGAVRVRLRTSTHREVVDVPEVLRGMDVRRIARHQPVDARVPPWRDGDVLVVPVYEEVVVRQLVLREEVHLVPTEQVRHDAQEIELARDDVIVERADAQGGWHPLDVPRDGVAGA